ncbi:Peptidase M23 [Denitrovibrio acetiphilus DSM 12809]|uniref:Peptidase M23 n=1 Tax=Denitrovibrio acetiphilus (strain DSM 12809 / NBRC 114555 / N2460) TaxID=522772 RepID=D4H0Z6_DENA2|nr:M23 family metallopeptidase [Denitrovibrio acetiphilus]ADD68659.1 Peptidase M23 [Denitrovibrio acetiphilus DSM 12809]
MKPQFRFLIVIMILFAFTATSYANIKTYRVKWGETLYSLLSDKFSPQEILNINKELKELLPDFTLQKGTLIKETENCITLQPNFLTDISINRVADDFELDIVKYPVSTVATVVEGEVTSSLIQAVTDRGESPELAFMLASIYEWEIDFFHALRKGDTFKILVEKQFARNKFVGYGKILAADFLNQGRFIRALYYETAKTKGYFKPDGTSMRKGFLKAPLRYSRISSGYSHSRLHPVTHKVQPHYGVDYAAPTGTPIHATADGRVTEKRYKGYNGNYVKIKHMNGYETLYLHLSRFNKKIHKGSYVRQGDIIGYVGATGRATGPHLDYRIRKNGSYLNPLRFKAPDKKLPSDELENFQMASAVYSERIDNTYIARTNRLTMVR